MSDNEPKKPMSRGTQTAWIVAAILAVGVGAFAYAETRLPAGHRNQECQRWYGVDQWCVRDLAAERLRGAGYGHYLAEDLQ